MNVDFLSNLVINDRKDGTGDKEKVKTVEVKYWAIAGAIVLGITLIGLRNWPEKHALLALLTGVKHVSMFPSNSVDNSYLAVGNWLDIFYLKRLPMEVQNMLSTVLLLPLGALLISVCRNMIGLTTCGTFAPLLLALGLVLNDWKIGLTIVLSILLIGVGVRRLLEPLKMLIVPRQSAIVIFVVLFMIFSVSTLHYLDPKINYHAVLLPVVILTGLIEQLFVTIEEQGKCQTTEKLLGTLIVGCCCYGILSSKGLGQLLLSYPELHCLTLAGTISIGGYSGYRVSELFRFRDFVDPMSGDREHFTLELRNWVDRAVGNLSATLSANKRGLLTDSIKEKGLSKKLKNQTIKVAEKIGGGQNQLLVVGHTREGWALPTLLRQLKNQTIKVAEKIGGGQNQLLVVGHTRKWWAVPTLLRQLKNQTIQVAEKIGCGQNQLLVVGHTREGWALPTLLRQLKNQTIQVAKKIGGGQNQLLVVGHTREWWGVPTLLRQLKNQTIKVAEKVGKTRRWIWPQELRDRGIVGINSRNAEYILPYNPRGSYKLVDNKVLTKEIGAKNGVPFPETYAIVDRFGDLKRLEELLAGREEFVIKPAKGSGGRGIMVIAGKQGEEFVTTNGKQISLAQLQSHLSMILSGNFSLGGNSDVAIIEQRIEKAGGLEAIAVGGTPDIRVILFRGVPVMAMTRLPTSTSGGRANLHQGAIAAGIDLLTGKTCGGVYQNRTVSVHPDTGNALEGFQIPHWEEILNTTILLGNSLNLEYLGVDLVIDADHGPMVLEVNARPGLAIQIANRCGLQRRLEFVKQQPAEMLAPDCCWELIPQLSKMR